MVTFGKKRMVWIVYRKEKNYNFFKINDPKSFVRPFFFTERTNFPKDFEKSIVFLLNDFFNKLFDTIVFY